MKKYNSLKLINKTLLCFAFLFCTIQIFANTQDVKMADTTHNEKSEDKKEEGKFDPGKFIIHHILDSHEWHIMKIGETEVTIPLPTILWTKNGLTTFMSSDFKAPAGQEENEHAEKEYNGYKLNEEGKIVALDSSAVYDFSITKNVLSLFISIILICVIFLSVAKKYKKNRNKAPKGFQTMIEFIILFLRDDVITPALGVKKTAKYGPFLMTLFFFIFINNLMGLIPFFPGGANLTGNIAVTLVLAVFTFVITTFSGNKSYWTHIVNAPGVPWWLKLPVPLMPIVELLGVFIKPFVLMVRLFANISAGHIIALGFFGLIFIFKETYSPAAAYGVSVVSVLFTVFMGLLELLVAFIQAYVFTLLSALYFSMATEEHH